MVFVGIDALLQLGLASLTIPIEFAVVGIVDHVTQLCHLALQCLNTVGLFDFQGGQPLKVERNVECSTRHNKCLRQVGSIHKVVLQLGHSATVLLQCHHLRNALSLSLEGGLHTQQTEDVACCRVALHRAVHQSRKSYFGIAILAQCHHLIPVACSAPVAFDEVVATLVGLVGHGDGIGRAPLGLSSKLAHHPQSEVDVRTTDNLARKLQSESIFQHGSNHQQGRYVLRADVAWNLQKSASKLLSCNLQWGISLLAYVFNVCSKAAQSVNQYGYWAMLHAVGTSDDVGAAHNTQIGRHESHGGTCCLDVYLIGHVSQGLYDHLCIIAIAQVFRQVAPSTQSIYYQRTV